MAEPKRITVTQIGTTKPTVKKDKRQLCHRFTLSLVRSTEKTCPEFSYSDLLKNTLHAEEDANGDEKDPFSEQDKEEHDKLQALAQSFEEKYAPSKPKKKKQKYSRIQEFVDLGDGYDNDDPFIDNTEAYDELVPSCLTTQHGGFYINSGKLDFRAVSDSEDDFQSVGKKKLGKKNIVTSDNESESLPKKRTPKKKFKDEDEIRKKKRKKLSSDVMDKPIIKRKKFERDGFRGLKLKKKKLNNVNELLKMTTSSPSSTAPNVLNGSQSESITERNDVKAVSAATLQNVESAIDSVISQSRNMGGASSDEESQDISVKPHSSQDGNEEEMVKLPDNLPPAVYDVIAKLKQAACDSEMGKKFFTPRVNQMLLQVENGSRQLSPGVRAAIYSHLAAFLPCGKETLIKRAKKLQLEQNDDKLREPIARLKEEINKSMPALIDKHQAELQAVQQMKRERKLEVRENGSTESDEEGEKPDADKQKRIMAPRRKFEWTPVVRNLLNQIVQIKLNHYGLSKIRSQTPEDYLKTFFEQELKPLWPQGWMQSRMLFKESRAVHQCWTNPSFKPRRPLTVTSGIRVSSPATTNKKTSTPVSVNTAALPIVSSGVSVSSGANTTLVPSVQKVCTSLSPSGASSDTSCSNESSPTTREKANLDSSCIITKEEKAFPVMSNQLAFNQAMKTSNAPVFVSASGLMSKSLASSSQQEITSMAKLKQPTMVHESTEHISKMSTEKSFNSVASSQAVSSTSRPYLTEATTASNLSQSSSPCQTTVSRQAGKTISKASLSNQKSVSVVSAHHDVVTNSWDSGRPSTTEHGIKTGSKPHLAAALQGMYFSTTAMTTTKSSHQTSHSFLGITQDSEATLKDTPQGLNTSVSLGQKQTLSSSSNRSIVSLSAVTSNRCQVKLSDVLLTNQKSQPKHQGNYQGTGLVVTSQESQMSSEHRSQQKKTGAVSGQSPTSRVTAQAGPSVKKFHISSADASVIRAGLSQAATQMVLKAQEKQISSSGPKRTSSDQQTSMKRTSPVGQQMDLSGLRRTSPVSQENSSGQHIQKQMKQAGAVAQQGSSWEKSKKATSANGTHLSSSTVSRGHSIQEKLSPVAHSTVAESGLFAMPGLPVTTSGRTVGVDQVSSTSGMGNSRSSTQPSSLSVSKTSVNSSITSQSQSILNAPSSIDSKRAHAQSQQQSSQVTDIPSTVLQPSASQHTSVHTVAMMQPVTSPVSGTPQNPVSVSLATFRQTSHQSNISHVTSSSHSTASRTSPSSSATRQVIASSQGTVNRIPSTGQHVTTSRLPQSSITSNNLLQTSAGSRMQQAQASGTSRVQLSQTTYGQPSSHAQHSQPTTSSRVPLLSSSSVGSHTQQPQTVASISSPALPGHPMASYKQRISVHSRPDSTSSASKTSEPKFGGLTLSQIQAQTLKASQKAHIQTAQQYSPQPVNTSTVYRSPEGSTVYGVSQLQSPGQSSHSYPYSNTSPTSRNHHQSPDPNLSANSPYGLLRTPPSVGHHNTSPAHRSSQNRY